MNEGDLLQRRYKNPKTYFCAKTPPAISIKQYLIHLIRHLGTPPATLMLMMIYVERFLQSLTQAITSKSLFGNYGIANSSSKHPYMLTSNNAHRIILTALLLAHKYSMDVAYPFSLIAKIVGVTSNELKILESEFLLFVKYELYVSQDLYAKYEEVFSQWPDIFDEDQENNIMDEDEPNHKITRIQNDEETKEKDETIVITKVKQAKLTDEEIASSHSLAIEQSKPNPASRHEKLVNDTPSSTIQNLDIRSLFYEDDPEVNSDEDEDTEMTLYGKFHLKLISQL